MFYADATVLEIAAQVVMGGFFIFNAFKNGIKPDMVIGRLTAAGYPAPKMIHRAGLAMMLAGGALVVLDYQTQIGALILFFFTFLATIMFQRWWTVEDPLRRPYNFMMFFYNLFIMGALLLLM
jgi:uncharacterized membrane protein YphA (DoxX/SURF4 family)